MCSKIISRVITFIKSVKSLFLCKQIEVEEDSFWSNNESDSSAGVFSVELFINAAGIVTSVLLCFLGFKLSYNSLPATAVKVICVIFFWSAGCIFLALAGRLKNKQKNRQLRQSNIILQESNISLQHEVSELITHSNIAAAAIDSTSFDCFISNIVGLLREDDNAQNLQVFALNNNKIIPHTFYQFSSFAELNLNFSSKNILFQDNFDILENRFDSALLSARDLLCTRADNDTLITGKLFYRQIPAGTLKLSLIDSIAAYNQESSEEVVSNALLAVSLGNNSLAAAVNTENIIVDALAGRTDMTLKLNFADMDLGLVRIGFSELLYHDIAKKKKIFASTAKSISRTLYHEKIYQLAIRDGLTNLYNKRYLLEALQQHFSLFVRNNINFSFLLIDIDFFKKVNDTWGHLTGDRVLKGIAELLLSMAREADITARYGGEELAVLLPETGLEGAQRLAERIRKAIMLKIFTAENGETFTITASFGVAAITSGMADIEMLVSAADKALYIAKEAGRNRVIISSVAADDDLVSVA